MTSVAKKTRGGEKPSPDVTAVLQPRRVNLGLTCPSHTRHTHAQTNTHTQSSNVLQISGDNTFISICIYLIFLPAETLTLTSGALHSDGYTFTS